MTQPVKIVFVGGAPRSGTTLVQRVLNAHPEVYGGPEFDFAPQMMEMRNRMAASITTGRISAIVDEAIVDECVRAFLNRIFSNRARSVGAKVFSEKTPSNLLYFEELSEVFPDAKFVCVIRDPRDVVASMKKVRERARQAGMKPPWFCRNVMSSVVYINGYLEKAERMQSICDRMLVLYHEELVGDPDTAARKLCQHVGIEFSPLMTAVEQSNMDTANAESLKLWYSGELLTGPIQKPEARVFNCILWKSEVAMVHRYLRKSPLLQRYHIGPPMSFSAMESMHGYWLDASMRLRNIFIDTGKRIHSRL